MSTEKYLLVLGIGSEAIGLQYDGETLAIYYRPLSYHAMRETLALFGWGEDQPDPPIAGEYKQRAVIGMTQMRWEAGKDAILEHIGTTAEMARAMRRLVKVKALGRMAW